MTAPSIPTRSLALIKKYWFFSALLLVCLATLADRSGFLADSGHWLKKHHGPDLVIVFIFIFSGFALNAEQLKDGLMDLKGIGLALTVIFIIAPLTAALISLAPLEKGIVIGLFLVAVMPSTLSSGVVMTAAAGGNAAHALVTTIAANSLAVFTIPHMLAFLLICVGESAVGSIDKGAIMLRIGLLVVLPLAVGMLMRCFLDGLYRRHGHWVNLINQALIIFIVWIAVSQTRGMLLDSVTTVSLIVGLVFVYHGLLLLAAWWLVRMAGRGRGRRESVLLIGSQKTLPLSIILQMALFPHYGIALLVCVLHHIVHLMMDGYIVERLKAE